MLLPLVIGLGAAAAFALSEDKKSPKKDEVAAPPKVENASEAYARGLKEGEGKSVEVAELKAKDLFAAFKADFLEKQLSRVTRAPKAPKREDSEDSE